MGQIIVLAAAGAIYYKASQKKSSLMSKADEPHDHRAARPTQEPYEEVTNHNRWVQHLISTGYQPKCIMGCMGVPMYLYPKPGGLSWYVVRNPNGMME